MLRPLVATLERDHPGTPLVISAFTATGLATARKLYARHRVVPLPVDLSFVVARYFRCFNPRLLVVAESEFWPNLISLAHARGVPAALVNGKMSAKSFGVHARTRLVPRVLAKFAVLADADRGARSSGCVALGVPSAQLHVTGNMKYDLTQAGDGGMSGAQAACCARLRAGGRRDHRRQPARSRGRGAARRLRRGARGVRLPLRS